jgi:N6-adenosine-specific RNA methylase IME4
VRNPQSATLTFANDTANKTGVSSRVIHEELQIADKLDDQVKETVRKHDIPKTDALKLARMEPEKQRAVVERIAAGVANTVSEVERQIKLETVKESLEDISAKKAKAIQGVYDVIVIDPPWKMEKIERDVAPNQAGFDYPAMSGEELAELKIPAAGSCHIFLWTTHKHLPLALRLLEKWGLKYVCTFVWHKNGGFQPCGLPQYNCEFCLNAHKGSPQLKKKKNFFTCFNADRTKHSEKPEIFYETLRRVTAGRRLDMFNRRDIKGFDAWGNEA